MDTAVYYFSGTGNSLYVAKAVAERLKGTLISIPSVMHYEKVTTEANRLIIIFPAYMAHLDGVPVMVRNFINKLDGITSKQLIAISTCGGYESVNALPALINLEKLVKSRGGKIFAAYTVRLPMNNLSYDHIPIPIVKDNDKIFDKSKSKIDKVVASIDGNKRTGFGYFKNVFNSMMTAILYRYLRSSYITLLKNCSKEPQGSKLHYLEMMQLSDKGIYIDDNCNGCAVCAKVCPAGNIEMIEKKPVWKHHCEMCCACDEWCPRHAIHHWERPDGAKYHHPGIKLSDMIMSKRN